MKKEKEYPATHSMSTAWYAIDKDGNVGLIEFEDNGPVPECIVESDESFDDLVFGHFFPMKDGVRCATFTDEQIDSFVALAEPVAEQTDLIGYAIVVIDVNKEACFLDALRRVKETECVCLSRGKGAYVCDFYASTEADEKRLMSLFEQKVILKLKNFSLCESDNQENEALRRLPFFIYNQDYDIEYPIECTFIPDFPFKETQLNEDVRLKALRLPFRFPETNRFQIAQYYDSRSYAGKCGIDGSEYSKLPMANGGDAYFRTFSVRIKSCAECRKCLSEKYQCGTYLEAREYCDTPTVLAVCGLRLEQESLYNVDGYLKANSIFIPYLQQLPGRSIFDGTWNMPDYIREEDLKMFFGNCRVHLDEQVSSLRPRVLLIFKEAMDVISDFYDMTDSEIVIGNECYPYFIWEDCKGHKDEIISLSSLPYRGKPVKRVITIEESGIVESHGNED